MKIDFIPNPRFKPAPPELKVGSVVMCNGAKAVVIESDGSRVPYRLAPHNPHIGAWFTKGDLKVLPERVCGWDEKGPMFEPMAKPVTPPFTWEQYPPRAWMVVEFECGGFRVLLAHGDTFHGFGDNGYSWTHGNADSFRTHYRPRPDLMPRFVEDE